MQKGNGASAAGSASQTRLPVHAHRSRAASHAVSGLVLDRIALQVEVPALTARELQFAPAGESSAAVRALGEALQHRAYEARGLTLR